MTTVQMYRDVGDGHPAVNVKIRSIRRDTERLLPLSLGGDDHTTPPEFTLEWIDQNMKEGPQNEWWMIACEQGFELAEEVAKELFGANVEVYQEGRSGGWLVVHGLGDVESWGTENLEAWNTFETRVQVIAEDTPRRWLEMVYLNVFTRTTNTGLRVWIDTASGTWGDVTHLRIVDLDNPELHDTDTDTLSLVAFLEGADDGEISDFGRRYGSTV